MGNCEKCVLRYVCEHRWENEHYQICWLDNYPDDVKRSIVDK